MTTPAPSPTQSKHPRAGPPNEAKGKPAQDMESLSQRPLRTKHAIRLLKLGRPRFALHIFTFSWPTSKITICPLMGLIFGIRDICTNTIELVPQTEPNFECPLRTASSWSAMPNAAAARSCSGTSNAAAARRCTAAGGPQPRPAAPHRTSSATATETATASSSWSVLVR